MSNLLLYATLQSHYQLSKNDRKYKLRNINANNQKRGRWEFLWVLGPPLGLFPLELISSADFTVSIRGGT